MKTINVPDYILESLIRHCQVIITKGSAINGDTKLRNAIRLLPLDIRRLVRVKNENNNDPI